MLIPNKLLVAVGNAIPAMDDFVPCVSIARCTWPHSVKESMEFFEQAVQRKGAAFHDLIGQARSKQANVKCRFYDFPFNVYYFGLEDEITINFE